MTPFHERTPIHTMSQDVILSPDPNVARRYGVWEDAPGRKRTLRAVLLADRAHIIASLALHFAPDIDVSHVFATTVAHVHAHPDIYAYVRITPPALLVWLTQEFQLVGEAFSSPMTCFDTPSHQHSHFTHMPMFLSGVSIHPRHQTRHSIPFEDQFTDPAAFPYSVLVSLDFPSVTSVAAARFFHKCYETTAAGHTVVPAGGFR